ncbi:MAG: hypothetical protein GDA51_01290 [Ekhidna sp.]|nr:hypothetical protein [Ekhidna sp.]MBC6410094.1 hypothetical protein [Ekhidna sp.]MBC6425114.1 hypothetical protein [Ekhidna sp.]
MNYIEFLNFWYDAALVSGFTMLGLGALNYLIFKINFAAKKTYKEKFDLVSKKETKRLLQTHLFIAGALFFFVNDAFTQDIELSPVWFIVRMFVSFCIAVLYGYVSYLVLQFHYPVRLEKKLKKLRYTPRINPKNGKEMILLNEDEEDAYLDEGMQAEESTFSCDYDVWIDESTGDTHIEKYEGHVGALECDRCGFQTLKLSNEEIIREPTETEDGEILKEYMCSYCHRIKRKNVPLLKKIKDRSEVSDHLIAEQ